MHNTDPGGRNRALFLQIATQTGKHLERDVETDHRRTELGKWQRETAGAYPGIQKGLPRQKSGIGPEKRCRLLPYIGGQKSTPVVVFRNRIKTVIRGY